MPAALSEQGRRTPSGCLEWTGRCNEKGYGLVQVSGKKAPQRVSRVVFESVNGPIPKGLCVLHTCDNPPCFESQHLYAGTKAQNTADIVDRGRDRGLFHGGVRHWNARLTDAQVAAIRAKRATGKKVYALAAQFGVNESHISRLTTGQRRTGR